MFFNSIQKVVKWKKCKIDKRMELGLYRQPVINFQRPKSTGTTATASLHISFVFQVNLVIFQSRNFLLPANNFQLFQRSTYSLTTVVIWMFRFEGNYIQTLLIQPKRYSLFEVTTSELNTPFPIKDFVSICRDLNFFDVMLPLFCKCCRLE